MPPSEIRQIARHVFQKWECIDEICPLTEGGAQSFDAFVDLNYFGVSVGCGRGFSVCQRHNDGGCVATSNVRNRGGWGNEKQRTAWHVTDD